MSRQSRDTARHRRGQSPRITAGTGKAWPRALQRRLLLVRPLLEQIEQLERARVLRLEHEDLLEGRPHRCEVLTLEQTSDEDEQGIERSAPIFVLEVELDHAPDQEEVVRVASK